MNRQLVLVGRDSAPKGSPYEAIKAIVLDSVTSLKTKRSYGWALDNFLAWYQATAATELNKATVQKYKAHLEGLGRAASTINVQLCAIRKLAMEACDNGLLDHGLAAGIGRVKGTKRLGVRAGNWLSREQVSLLLRRPDARTLKGKRDRALLAILIGCGLRRSEARALTVNSIQQRDGRWVIPDLIGKGNRIRTVQVPAWVKVALDIWLEASALTEGRIFRSINRGGRMWGEGICEWVIHWTVRQYAKQLGLGALAPHDLRRTCAKICKDRGGNLEQIQLMLGHASVQTTEAYLGTKQNLRVGPNDDMGLDLDW